MFCVKCGEKLPDDAAFCFKCGSRTGEHAEIETEWNEVPKETSVNRAGGRNIVAGIGVFVLVLILGAVIMLVGMFALVFGVSI